MNKKCWRVKQLMFCLSSKGLKNVPKSLLPDDFEFILVGNTYKTNKILADFTFPAISRLHSIDPTISTYMIPIDDRNGFFSFFVDLMHGIEISPPKESFLFLIQISSILENSEIHNHFFHLEAENISYSNCIFMLKQSQRFNLASDHIINVVAYHISLFCIKDFRGIEPHIMEMIFESKALRIESEDELLRIAHGMINELGGSYSSLYCYIDFQAVTKSTLKTLIHTVSKSKVSASLWDSVQKRLIEGEYKSIISKRKSLKKVKLNVEDGSGICGLLRKDFSRDYISITTSSVKNGNPDSIINIETTDFWCSENLPNQYVILSLKNIVGKITHYQIRTNNIQSQKVHMQDWILETSNDGIIWNTLDSQYHSDCLKESWAIGTFTAIDNQWNNHYRLKMNGKNTNGSYYMYITGFELFGTFFFL